MLNSLVRHRITGLLTGNSPPATRIFPLFLFLQRLEEPMVKIDRRKKRLKGEGALTPQDSIGRVSDLLRI